MKNVLHLFTKNIFAILLSLAFLLPSAALFSQAGEALDFDGSNDYVEVPNSASLESYLTSGGLTVEFIINPSNLSGPAPTVVSKRNASNSAGYVFEYIGGAFNTWVNFSGNWVSAPVALTLNQWQHIAVTAQSGVGVKTYVNGVLIASASHSGSLTASGDVLRVGANTMGAPSNYFTGKIDEVRIWSRALCQAEIASQKDCELSGSVNGLVAYYKFNQGIAGANNAGETTLTDASGNANHGTLIDFALSGSTSNWVAPGGVTSGNSCPAYNAPEINLQGNSNSIADGDNTPSTADHTDFGSVVVNSSFQRTFTIQNTSTSNLTVSTITVTGTHQSEFVISGISLPATISGGGSTTFIATFTPMANGTRSAVIHVNNNDCDEADYDFAVQGTGAVEGAALNFDGANDFVDLGTSLGNFGTSDFTVEAWFKVPTSATGALCVMGKRSACGHSNFWNINIISGQVHFEVDQNNVNYLDLSTTSAYNDNNWHQVACTRSGTALKIYIDGALAASGNTAAVTNLSNSDALKMGSSPCAVLNGSLDEVRIWSRALCQAEISAQKDSELSGSENGLLAYYKFNQGIASGDNTGLTTLNDAAGTPENGTLIGFALTGSTSNWVAPGGVTTGNSCPAYNAPEINLQGNSNSIADGDNTPSTADHTDFESVIVNASFQRTFTIQNTGTSNLTVSSITVTGTNSSEFVVSGISLPATIGGSGSTTFTVTFTPTATGSRTATIHVNNNDCDEADYDFAVQGTGAVAGAALNFDGSNDLVSISGISLTGDFTIEAWIYVQATGEAFPTVFSQNGDNLVMWLHSGGGYSLAARVGGYQVDGTSVSLNTWTHVALTRSGNTITLYQNGSQTGTSSSSATPSGGTFYLGYWTGNGRYFKGTIDEMRIWNTARTAGEISANMSAEIATMPVCLLAYYKFNEGIANGGNAGVTNLPDIANNTSQNGTLSNFALTGSSSNWTTGSGISQNSSSYQTNYPDINLQGNGNSIPDGTTSTSSTNFTALGNAITGIGKSRSFTIQNTGTATLTVSSISFSGTNAADFSASGISLPATISASGSATFNVLFNPSSAGSKTATINIVSDDCDEGNYDFALSGTGTTAFTFSSNSDWATAANWDVEVVPTTANLTSGRSVVIAQNCTMNDVTVSFASGTSLTVNSSRSLNPSANTYVTINSGATLTVQATGSMSSGRFTNSGTMNISGSYTAFYMTNNSGGIFNVLSGGSYSCPACAEDFKVGGTINNSGTMHAGTASTWQGTINNNAGGTITDGGNGAQIQLGASSTMNNSGSFVSRTAGTSGIFNNLASGTLTMPATCNFTVKSGSTFTNDGSVTVGNSDNFFIVNSGGTVTNQNTISGIGTITQSGTFTNSAAADLNPGNSPGKLTVTGPLDLGSATYNCEINGTTQGTGYDWLAVSGNATLTNASLVVNWGSYTPTAGLTFTILTCGSRTGTFSTVTIPPVSGLIITANYNSGSVTITTASAPVTYTFTGSGNWSSSGNWNANGVPPSPLLTGDAIVINGSGTATLDVSQTINSGATLTVNANKTLQITGAFTLTNNGTMTINGTFSKSSGSSGLTNSATGSITVPSGGALNNDAGSFSNAGNLETNSGGTFGNGSGTFTNSGTYNNGGSHYSTYGGFSNSGTITNTGTMTSGQYINIGNSGTWTNSSGGTMDMNSFNNSGASASLTNNGTMNIGLSNSKTFVNNATFTVNYFGQSNNSGATWTNSSGATFTVGAVPFSNAGTFNNDGTMTLNQTGNTGSTFTNTGTFNCAGTLTLNSGTGSNAATKTISLSGTLNVNSSFAFTNNGIINGGGSLNIAGGSLTNNGSISNPGYIGITSNGTLTIANGGTLTTQLGSNTNMINGTLTIATGGLATMNGQVDITGSTGNLVVNGTWAHSFTFNNQGNIKGDGTLTLTSSFSNNNGKFKPGNSPGTLDVTGNLNLSNGTYEAEINGTGQGTNYDLLVVSGTATVSSATLHLIFGYAAANGSTYDVLTANTVSGSFPTVTFANTGSGNVTAVAVSYPGGNTVRVTVTSPLPVELVDFQAELVSPSVDGGDEQVRLTWWTASELNNEGFYVERMTVGSAPLQGLGVWEKIGFVVGNGTTTESHDYSFLDEKPLPGVNYYRLRQMDFDGGEELSKVISVFLQKENTADIRVYPTLTAGALWIEYGGEQENEVLVFNASGQFTLSGKNVRELDLSGFQAGVYFVQVQTGSGKLTQRILKQ